MTLHGSSVVVRHAEVPRRAEEGRTTVSTAASLVVALPCSGVFSCGTAMQARLQL